jgi:hypothetical protein
MSQESDTHPQKTSEQEGSRNTPLQRHVGKRVFGRIDRDHPIGGEMSDILQGILRHARLPWLLAHHSNLIVLALFSFINGCISIGLMSILAVLTRSPFVFPSLGPTAFLFFYTPTAPSASPRNTLIGHAIGVCAGYFSLVVTGLTMAGPALAVLLLTMQAFAINRLAGIPYPIWGSPRQAAGNADGDGGRAT